MKQLAVTFTYSQKYFISLLSISNLAEDKFHLVFYWNEKNLYFHNLLTMEKSLSVTFFAASFRPTAAFFDEEIAILIKRTVNWSQNKWIGLTWWKMEEKEGEEEKAYDLIEFDGDFQLKID